MPRAGGASDRDPDPGFYREPGRATVLFVVVFDDDMAPVMPAFDRTRGDDDVITAMVLAVPMALTVVVKRLGTVPAVMEALAVLVDDRHAIVVPMVTVMMPVRGDDDRVCRSHGRRGQAQRQGAKNDGGFHCELSEILRRPSLRKHPALALVPAWIASLRNQRPYYGPPTTLFISGYVPDVE
jgi:hypothetical protein